MFVNYFLKTHKDAKYWLISENQDKNDPENATHLQYLIYNIRISYFLGLIILFISQNSAW